MVCPVFCFHPRTDAFTCGFPKLRKLVLRTVQESCVEYARALIAHAVRPQLMLDIEPLVGGGDTDVWHPFDTVLFALQFCHKSQVRVPDKFNTDFFPLMSLFDSD